MEIFIPQQATCCCTAPPLNRTTKTTIGPSAEISVITPSVTRVSSHSESRDPVGCGNLPPIDGEEMGAATIRAETRRPFARWMIGYSATACHHRPASCKRLNSVRRVLHPRQKRSRCRHFEKMGDCFRPERLKSGRTVGVVPPLLPEASTVAEQTIPQCL